MPLNVLDEKGKEKFKQSFFTEKGHDTLMGYARSLCMIYLEDKPYPKKIGVVLGVPLFEYAQTLLSKELLLERIKAYFQILGIYSIDVKMPNGSIQTVSFEKK